MNIAPNLTKPAVTTGPLPGSRKIHVAGTIHPDIRVAMREVALDPSAKEPPVRIYDASGPYTDATTTIDIAAGLPPLRTAWVVAALSFFPPSLKRSSPRKTRSASV